MKLHFDGLVIYNFKSFNGKHKFDLNSYDSGLHFIRGINKTNKRLGSNGSGKSTLWDSICWCLYGKTARGLKNPDVKPWAKKKKTFVSVTIYIDDEKYVIKRTISPNSLSINGEDCGQDQVDDLLCLSFEVFTNTIFMGQARPLLFDLKAADKLKLFSEVLNLDKWDARSKIAASKVNDMTTKQSNLSYALHTAKTNLEQVERTYSDVRSQSQAWEDERQSKFTADEKTLKESKEQLAACQDRLSSALLAYDSAMTEHNLFLPTLHKAQKAEAFAQNKINRAKARLSIRKSRLMEVKSKLKDSDDKVCATCGQKIKASQAKSHLQEMRDEISELQARIDKGVPKKYIRLLDERKEKVDRINKEVAKLLEDAKKHDHNVAYFTPKVSELKAAVTLYSKHLENFHDEINPYRKQLVSLKTSRQKWKTEITEKQKELDKAVRTLERSRFWVKGFKDVKLFVLDEVLLELQLTTNAMLQDVGLEGWQILYDVEKETKAGTVQRGLNVSIISPKNKNPVRWENWSGGEGQRLRLVGALSLSEVLLNYAGVEPDMEILDEPTAHMSGEGIRDLCDLLAIRAKHIDRRIFYIDHQSVEGAQFNSVTTIVNDSQGSRIKGVST